MDWKGYCLRGWRGGGKKRANNKGKSCETLFNDRMKGLTAAEEGTLRPASFSGRPLL